jgi:predicted PurR-regulated permease PerM
VNEAPARAIVRIVLIVVGVVLSLYLLYQLRKPISWLLIATFLAVALSGPVNRLQRHMRRGLAIAGVYLGLLAVPALLIALIVPTLITQADKFAQNLPKYSRDVSHFVNGNARLRKINHDYNITEELQQQANKLPTRLGGAAKTLGDIGFGLINSVFALVTILILTAFRGRHHGHRRIVHPYAAQAPLSAFTGDPPHDPEPPAEAVAVVPADRAGLRR